MHIYPENNNLICFLKTLSFYTQNKILMQDLQLYQFYTSTQNIYEYNTYQFFNDYNNGLSLEVQEEIFDQEKINCILEDISKVRG